MNTNTATSSMSFSDFINSLFVQRIPNFLIKAVGMFYVSLLAIVFAVTLVIGLLGIGSLAVMLFGNAVGVIVVVAAILLITLGPVPSWLKQFGQEVYQRFAPAPVAA